MITTIIFDLDDTLYDEIEYCRSGLKIVAEFLGSQPNMPVAEQIFDAFWKQFSQGNRTKIFNAAFDSLGVAYTDNFIGELVQVYRNHKPAITLPTDSRDVLEKLKSRYTLALLTDGFLPAQRLKVEAIGIEKYFKCTIYTEQLGREFWKPSPEGFKKIMATLKTKPQNMAYVADDEEKDFVAPNRLGFLTVRVIRQAGIHTERCTQPDAAAKYAINGISRLPDLLAKL